MKELKLNARERLEELLIDNYNFMKNNNGRTEASRINYIQGFIEACLIERTISRVSVEQIINQAHLKVFGVDFQSRNQLKEATEEWLDIPTHIRHKKNIDIEK